MKILQFQILNTKAIRSLAYECSDGGHITIAGKTGKGKTTAASGLWEIMEASPDILRHGTRKGSLRYVLGTDQPELIATRRFTEKTQTVEIERADGASVSVKDFRAMVSKLAVNPHKIKDMKPLERMQTLLQAADLGDVDLASMDKKIAEAENWRLESGRKAALMEPGIEPEHADTVDVSALSADLEKIREHNAGIEREQQALARIAEQGRTIKATITEREQNVSRLKAELAAAEQALASAMQERDAKLAEYRAKEASVKALVMQDAGPVQAKLAGATAINNTAARWQAWAEKLAAQQEQVEIQKAADDEVKKLRQQKADALAGAKWPLPGLSIEGEDIVYHGALFENLGESQKMLVCAALVIKDVLRHPIHVIRMDGAESMGTEDRAALASLYDQHGIQIISTIVTEGAVPEGCLTITEGQAEQAAGKEE